MKSSGLAEEAGDEYLVGGSTTHRNRTNEIAARFEDGHNHPKLSSARLRSTSIVTHLTLGTRLPELLAGRRDEAHRDVRRAPQVSRPRDRTPAKAAEGAGWLRGGPK